jgi:5-methylcytosine-specific restriction endonuclease McrA
MKRSAWKKKSRKPLRYRGRKTVDIVKKSGRIILSKDHYAGLIYECWIRDEKKCRGCGRSLPEFSTALGDHVQKRSQGGSDTPENIKTKCFHCHDRDDNRGGKVSRKMRARREVYGERA